MHTLLPSLTSVIVLNDIGCCIINQHNYHNLPLLFVNVAEAAIQEK